MITVLYIVLAVAVAVLAMWLLTCAWFSRSIAASCARIRATEPAPQRGDLPDPVRSLARRAGAGAGEAPRAARFTQAALLRLAQGRPFQKVRATQHVALGAPAFAWDAILPLGPFAKLRVLDAYDADGGRLEARLFGAFPVAVKTGPDLALGEALRYLAELPWAPDAILGNRLIQWRVPGERRIEAALEIGAEVARVTFTLNADGDIETVEAKDRPALDRQGHTIHHDWRGRFWGYRQIGPRRIPEWGEVGYVYPEGYESYFRGRITAYELHY